MVMTCPAQRVRRNKAGTDHNTCSVVASLPLSSFPAHDRYSPLRCARACDNIDTYCF